MLLEDAILTPRRSAALTVVLLLITFSLLSMLPKTTPPIASMSQPGEEHKSFSELTLFLLGSGVALFVALVGWSDQIRGIDRDTRELERAFLAETGVSKKDFLSLIRATSPDDELAALTGFITGGVLQEVDHVQLLGIFKNWNKDWRYLENLAAVKYTLTVGLTITFFISGTVSIFTNSNQRLVLLGCAVKDEVLLLLCPVVLMGMILAIIIHAGRREMALRESLRKIMDMV